MLDSVKVLCPHCKKFGSHSLSFIQGQVKRMKMDKSYEVAQQMADKRGPFYDKWLAAMKKRGEQKRCKDCFFVDRFVTYEEGHDRRCVYNPQNPGAFACSEFFLKC